jgi:hypothetical protein
VPTNNYPPGSQPVFILLLGALLIVAASEDLHLQPIINLVVTLVPVAGLAIAWVGLDTWRRQIKGTDKYKVDCQIVIDPVYAHPRYSSY